MRMSRLLVTTLRENPADAEVVSHQLLVRAGYIRRLANGVYSYLPLMWRVLRKVEQIVREEMDRAGAQELLMPILQPAELWQASGRWEVYGPLMMRVQDRHERWYGLAPTAEEVITDIATREARSYRRLPINLYQIQTKYRDETRPRFGLLRGREFIMKDAYSFHAGQGCLDREYDGMAKAYTRIFDRCGLETVMVRSDSGAIGGSVSHEFMVLTRIAEGEQESGENDVFYCDTCDYAANAERAESILPPATIDGLDVFNNYKPNEIIGTPQADSIEKLSQQLNCPTSLICKTLLYIKDEKAPFLVMIRGDLEAEETKIINAVLAKEIRMATAEEIKKLLNSEKGFIGVGGWEYACRDPLNSEINITLQFGRTTAEIANESGIPTILDKSILALKNFVIAFNEPSKHIVNFNWDDRLRSSLNENSFDLKRSRINDFCPECKTGKLKMTRGIEVGNIFQLGTKYSEKMAAVFADEDGTEKPFLMGCYGIGITRTAAAAVERFHDGNGIVWPLAIAPYHAVVIAVNVQDETQLALAEKIYNTLQAAGLEAVLDDRDERAGVKFKDADLIGFPIRITAGKKAAEGLLECKLRDAEGSVDLPADQVLAWAQKQLAEWHPFQQKSLSPA